MYFLSSMYMQGRVAESPLVPTGTYLLSVLNRLERRVWIEDMLVFGFSSIQAIDRGISPPSVQRLIED